MLKASENIRDALLENAHELRGYCDANNGDPTKAREPVIACIQRLLRRPGLIEEFKTFGLERPGTNSQTNWVLYYDPKLMYVIGFSEKGRYDSPHNHGHWLATAVYSGEVEYTDYRRIDDGTRPGHAELKVATRTVLKAGDVALTPPPPHDIHENTMLTDNFTMIVMGGKFSSVRQYYDLKTNTYVEKAI